MTFFKISKLVFISIFVIIFCVFINSGYAAIDWAEPSSDPPDANVAPPLNQGATPQHKQGSLVIGSSSNEAGGNALKVVGSSNFGDTSFKGNISVETDSRFIVNKTNFLLQDSSQLQLLNNSFATLSSGTYINLLSGSYIQGVYSGNKPIINLTATGLFGEVGLLSSESKESGVSIFGATAKNGIAFWGVSREEGGLAARFDGETTFNSQDRRKTATINGYVLAPNGFSTIKPGPGSGVGNNLTEGEAYQDNTVVTQRVCFLNQGRLDCANSITDPDSENNFIWNAKTSSNFPTPTSYQDASIRVTEDIKTKGVIYVYGNENAPGRSAEIKIQSDPRRDNHWGIYNDIDGGVNNLVFWAENRNRLTLQNDGGVKIHDLAGASNRCLYVDSGGVIQAKSDDCGLANNNLLSIPCNNSVATNPSNALKVGENSYVYDSSCGMDSGEGAVEAPETFHIQSGETINIGSNPALASTATVLKVTNASNVLLTVLGNGNIGIGTTNPSTKLQVNGAIQLDSTTAPSVTTNRLYNTGGNLFWNGLRLNNLPSNYWTLNGEQLYATSTVNKVGVGTITPDSTLDLRSSSGQATISIKSGTESRWKIFEGNGYPNIYGYNGSLRFNANWSNDNAQDSRLIITNQGQVAINSDVPITGYALSVNGSAYVAYRMKLMGELCFGSETNCMDDIAVAQCPPKRVMVAENSEYWDEWAKYFSCEAHPGYVVIWNPEICDGGESAHKCKYILVKYGLDFCEDYCRDMGFQRGVHDENIDDSNDNNSLYKYSEGVWTAQTDAQAHGARKCNCYLKQTN